MRGGSALGGARLAESDESFAQVLGPGGEVRDATRGVGASPLLTPDELDRARRETVVVEYEGVRLLATPVDKLVVVAGASLEDRNDALAALRTQLLVGGPLVLLLASLAGYVLAAATLRPVLARLEAGLERERRFVADASHELRTPLSLLKAELEVALRRPRTPEELHAALASAAEETDRLVRLAEDLLVLARADEGELRLGEEPVEVRALLDAVARRFAAAGRALEVDAPVGLAVTGDRLRLDQALGNLVDNALRYGSGTIRLTASGTTAASPSALRTKERASPRRFSRTRSSVSHGPMSRAPAAPPASGSRLCRRSPAPRRPRGRGEPPGGGAVVTLTALSPLAPSPRGRGSVR